MRKRDYLKAGILLLSALPCAQASWGFDDASHMNVYMNVRADVISLLLEGIDKMTFGSNAMTVHMSDDATDTLPYDDLRKFTFGEKNQTTSNETIDDAFDTLLSIRYQSTNKTIVIESASPIETIGVYNLQGILKYQSSPQVENATLSMADYPSGIYIIRANNGETVKTERIIKR